MAASEDVQFLGSAMLTRPMTATGLGTLQRPLIDLYAASFEPKTGSPLALPFRRLTITERGLIVTESDTTGEEQDTFYSMPSVVFWEAVRFVAVRVSDKKYRGAFEPIGERQMAKENLYTDLEKQCCHLANAVKQHPSLIVLVLRRTSGVKALELQAYACGSPRHAMHIVECLGVAQSSHGVQLAHASNVFSYSTFDHDEVAAVPGGLQVINTVSPVSGTRMANDLRRPASTVSAVGLSSGHGLRDFLPRNTNNRMSMIPEMTANPSAYSQSCYDLDAPVHRQIVPDDRRSTASSGWNLASESVGSAAGGALEGYYDQPRAVPLPIRGAGRKAELSSSAPSHVQEKSGSRPVARSRTFLDSSSTANVSVLHRSLIQQSSADPNLAPFSRNEVNQGDPRIGGPGDQGRVMTSPEERVAPVVAPRSKPARSQTFNQSSGSSPEQQSRRYGERAQPEVNKSSSDAPEFLFGFNVTPPDDDHRRATTTTATDNKPVAMVQPRKVAGVRVLPSNIDISASSIYQNHHQAQKKKQQQQQQPLIENQLSKTPDAAIISAVASGSKPDIMRVADNPASKPEAQQVRNNASPKSSEAERRLEGGGIGSGAGVGLDGGHDARRIKKEPKTDGILSLRTLRGNPLSAGSGGGRPALQASTFSDVNGNNIKTPIYGNVADAAAGAQLSSPSSSSSSTAAAAAPRATNNFDYLRVSSDQSRGDSGPAGVGPRSRGPSPQPPSVGAMVVDGSEDLSSKDKEIASAIGNMRIDYEPSMATLQAQGTNFEKYLGYFP